MKAVPFPYACPRRLAGRLHYVRVCKCDPGQGTGAEKGQRVGALLGTNVNLKIRHICNLVSSSCLCFWKGDVMRVIETSR